MNAVMEECVLSKLENMLLIQRTFIIMYLSAVIGIIHNSQEAVGIAIIQ